MQALQTRRDAVLSNILFENNSNNDLNSTSRMHADGGAMNEEEDQRHSTSA